MVEIIKVDVLDLSSMAVKNVAVEELQVRYSQGPGREYGHPKRTGDTFEGLHSRGGDVRTGDDQSRAVEQ